MLQINIIMSDWLGKGDATQARKTGKARSRAGKRTLAGNKEEEEEVKRREEAFLKKIKTRVEEEMEIEDKKGLKGIKKNNDPPIPKFAHICTSVRKKEERKQLMGFECKQCEHYYQSRLDDGFTIDQVEEMKNRISKHRGLFKPPRTPERFWDPDIIEDSAEDPRNKIIHASPLRKRREEKAFEVGEFVNGDEFE